jgi:integrase
MAQIRDGRLENRTARRRLKPRRKPYWVRVAPTIWLGYRALQKPPGSWNVGGDSKRWIRRIAWADDNEDANGKTILNFWQAGNAAKALARGEDGAASDRPILVAEALDTYEKDLGAKGGGTYNARRARFNLGGSAILATPVALLSDRELKLWRDGLISKGLAPASVNRTMCCLRAALTAAADADPRITRRPWKTALRNLPDVANVRRAVMPDADIRKLVAAAYQVDRRLGILCEVLATCGPRLSQAARLTVGDFQADRARLMMPRSGKGSLRKRGERIAVPIPPSLVVALRLEAAGRPPDAPLLRKSDGMPWQHAGEGDHRRLFREAVARASFDPDEITSYAFRHSSITRALLASVPIRVVAALHDTSVAQIERCYSRFLSDHSDALARSAMIDLTVPTEDNVVPYTRKG